MRDVVAYGALGAVLFLFLCGIVFMDDGALLPQNLVHWARTAYHFLALPLAPPPSGSDLELIPHGLILSFLAFGLVGFIVHLVKP